MKIAHACICCGAEALSRSPAILMPFVANRVFGWTPVEITAGWGLRTIPQGMAYPLCTSLQCQACGTLFLDMRFDDDEMGLLYGGYRGQAYAEQRDRFEPGYLAYNATILVRGQQTEVAEAFLAPHLPLRPRVLDWGGDDGAHTPFMDSNSGLDVYDLSGQPVAPGVRAVTREQMGAYDLIVLSHVLEHTPWPEDVLRQITAVMTSETVLYVETPFEALMAEGRDARDLAGRKTYWHEHINFFTAAGLEALLSRCGLTVIASGAPGHSTTANFDRVLAFACRKAASN